ncbi:hypothetical protein Tcan_01379, partial [Toxocara canis]
LSLSLCVRASVIFIVSLPAVFNIFEVGRHRPVYFSENAITFNFSRQIRQPCLFVDDLLSNQCISANRSALTKCEVSGKKGEYYNAPEFLFEDSANNTRKTVGQLWNDVGGAKPSPYPPQRKQRQSDLRLASKRSRELLKYNETDKSTF